MCLLGLVATEARGGCRRGGHHGAVMGEECSLVWGDGGNCWDMKGYNYMILYNNNYIPSYSGIYNNLGDIQEFGGRGQLRAGSQM